MTEYNRRPICYIAGPYRGANAWEIRQNIIRAEAKAFTIWELGAVALCPHLNTAHFQGSLDDHVWLDGDLEMLRRCDALVLVAGYGHSAGAIAELTFARELGLMVFFPTDTTGELTRWIAQWKADNQ